MATTPTNTQSVFANHARALNWLQTPNPSLQGKTPIEADTTEEGFAEADVAHIEVLSTYSRQPIVCP